MENEDVGPRRDNQRQKLPCPTPSVVPGTPPDAEHVLQHTQETRILVAVGGKHQFTHHDDLVSALLSPSIWCPQTEPASELTMTVPGGGGAHLVAEELDSHLGAGGI